MRNQSPQLEATQNDDLDATFLDGAIQPAPATFTARYQQGHWIINGGATSGIPAPSGSDAARLALYPFDAPAADSVRPVQGRGDGPESRTSSPRSSRLAIEKKVELDPKATYKAIIVSLPTPPLRVASGRGCRGLHPGPPGPEDSLARRKALALHRARPPKGETPEFRLIARDGQFVITRPNDDRPLVAQIDGLNEDGAKRAVARLEHMARWTQTARLSNPASSIQPGDVKLTILVDGKEVSGREIRLEYQFKNGKQVEPTFQVSMTNNSRARSTAAARPDPALPGVRGTDQGRLRQAGAGRDGLGLTWASRSRRAYPTRSGSKGSSSTRTCSS